MNVPAETLDWIRKAENDLAAAYLLTESEQPLSFATPASGVICRQLIKPWPKWSKFGRLCERS
jgi:hypothetical protein